MVGLRRSNWVGVSANQLGWTETAGKGIVSDEVGGTDNRNVQTGVGEGTSELGGSVTARTKVVSWVELDRTVKQGSDWSRSGWD